MKRSLFAVLFLLAACPDDSFTPETPLSEMSAGQLRGICDEEVAARSEVLSRAALAMECVIQSTTDFDLRTCDPEIFDPCMAELPATSDVQVSCYISDSQIEWLQYCDETTAEQFRTCLTKRLEVNASVLETECYLLSDLDWKWEDACQDLSSRCPAIDFEFLLADNL